MADRDTKVLEMVERELKKDPAADPARRELKHRLTGIVRDISWLYRALVAARSLYLREWCIGHR